MFKSFFGGLLVIIAVIGGIVGLGYGGWAMYNWLGPKYENSRRNIMINSRWYNEATIREMYNMKMQWEESKDPTVRATIAAAARHEFVIYPQHRLPPDLQSWWDTINQPTLSPTMETHP